MALHAITINGVNHANNKFTVSFTGAQQGAQQIEIDDSAVLAYAQQGAPAMTDENVLQLELIQLSATDPDFATLDELQGKTVTASDPLVSVS